MRYQSNTSAIKAAGGVLLFAACLGLCWFLMGLNPRVERGEEDEAEAGSVELRSSDANEYSR